MTSRGVTAIIPTYNRRKHVSRAVDSVLRQTTPVQEILVVDDGSTDGTADMLEDLYGSSGVRVMRQANGGVSAARRAGVFAATQGWICFLDSDDAWLPDHVALLTQAAGELGDDAAWVFGDTLIVGDDGSESSLFADEGFAPPSRIHRLPGPLGESLGFLTYLQSSLISRDALLAAGAFQEGLRSSEDVLVAFRIALTGAMGVVDAPVTRLYRTADLADSSLNLGHGAKPDFYRARMLAFADAVALKGPQPWAALHEGAARGLALTQMRAGASGFRASLAQFRYTVRPRALVFSALAALGPAGLWAWDLLDGARRKAQPPA